MKSSVAPASTVVLEMCCVKNDNALAPPFPWSSKVPPATRKVPLGRPTPEELRETATTPDSVALPTTN
ncbi:hypothetical protein D9M68_723890 [compost metagenome]